MLFSDTYYEIQSNSESSLREKGSKFIAFSFLVRSELDVKLHLATLKSKFPDATHHCFAYVIGQGSEAQRFNDDGEPSNSAGRPILRAILSNQLTNVLVVVVRYFGGTLLGIPGLIQSYGDSANSVLSLSGKQEFYIEQKYSIATRIENENDIFRLLSNFTYKVIHREYTESNVNYQVSLRRNQVSDFEKKIKDSYLLDVKPMV